MTHVPEKFLCGLCELLFEFRRYSVERSVDPGLRPEVAALWLRLRANRDGYLRFEAPDVRCFVHSDGTSMPCGNNPLLLRCDQWVGRIWSPRLPRCQGILVRDYVVPIGCDQMLSSFVWREAGTLRFRSKLLRLGTVMTGPSLTKVILAPDF